MPEPGSSGSGLSGTGATGEAGTGETGAGVIVGAGGQARVVAALLSASLDASAGEEDGGDCPARRPVGYPARGKVEVAGILDRTTEFLGEQIGRWQVFATFDDIPSLPARGIRRAWLAVGDNRQRRQLYQQCRQAGLSLPPLIHPSAIIEPGATVGDGSVICAGAILAAGAQVGRGCIVNTAASLDHESILGDFSHLAPGVRVAGRCRIGRQTFLGVGACVIDHITIGDNVTVGAGAVVLSSLGDSIVAFGVPAREHRKS